MEWKMVTSWPKGLPGLATWLARSLVPVAIGVGLWWRGGALSVAELTPAEVRTEFSVLAVCLLMVLAVVRPFVLADPTLLGASVAVFAVGGLVGMALSRQDAAEVVALSYGRALAATTAVLPAVSAVALVSVLRPELLGAMWLTLARLIELMLMPIGLLLAWLIGLTRSVHVRRLPERCDCQLGGDIRSRDLHLLQRHFP